MNYKNLSCYDGLCHCLPPIFSGELQVTKRNRMQESHFVPSGGAGAAVCVVPAAF